MSNQLLVANFNGGLRAPHYFNGRLLSAEELQTDQRAVLTRQGWLGQASGYGVVDGLMVTQLDATNIKITAGSGLNRQGELLHLSDNITLPLPLQGTLQPVNSTGSFTASTSQSTQSPANSTTGGAYLLTALPASHFEGLAPTQFTIIANGTNNAPYYGNQWEVEGVQFKIIRLDDFDKVSGVNDTNRRNLLAHWCYGSEVLPNIALDPFHFSDTAGGLDHLDPADLTPGDLPLAVFYWTGTALSFVDVWPARRRLIHPDALVDTAETVSSPASNMPQSNTSGLQSPPQRASLLRTWKGLLGDRRLAVAQARFLQFQDLIQQLVDEKKASTVALKDYFRFLPPVGFLPVTLDSLQSLVGSPISSIRAHSDPFLITLQSLLQIRQAVEGPAGSLVNRGENSFDYAAFFDNHQYFWIRSTLNGFVMDVQGDAKSGFQVVNSQLSNPPQDNQLWSFENGCIVSRLNGYVLTVPSSPSLKPPVQLTISPKSIPQTPDQQWSMDTDGHLVCKSNSLVVDIQGSSQAADTPVIIFQKNDALTPNQQWHLDPFLPDPGTDSSVPFVINRAIVESAEITSLLQQSWYDGAIDITRFPDQQKAHLPVLNMYFVRESLVSPSSQPYVVFARVCFPAIWSIRMVK
jgi:hypothetical protein